MRNCFSNYETLSPPRKIYLADNRSIIAKGIGKVPLQLIVEGDHREAVLHDVLFAPNIHDNLISVNQIIARGHSVLFDESGCKIYKDNQIKAFATKENGLYKLVTARNTVNIAQSALTWH